MTITHHTESLRDRAAMLAMRAMIALQPDAPLAPEGRVAADEMLAKTPAAEGVAYGAASVGGVSGWWCEPAQAEREAAMLYLHGGAYVVGSAAAYRHFVGQIAARTGLSTFAPDYALAPERPFPAAFDDAMAVYRGLLAEGRRRIVLGGDSAGGGLALALLAAICADSTITTKPRSTIVLSPWIDLSLSGESVTSRAKADPFLTREKLAGAASLYLRDHDTRDPRVDVLQADLADLPPVQIHVGEDEILLDDSMRYEMAAVAARSATDLHIWKGMTHVFPSGTGRLEAADQALSLMGAFSKTASC